MTQQINTKMKREKDQKRLSELKSKRISTSEWFQYRSWDIHPKKTSNDMVIDKLPEFERGGEREEGIHQYSSKQRTTHTTDM